jgi:hypothetical protein
MENISILYEEYCSERFSNTICENMFLAKSHCYLEHIKSAIKGHYENILDMNRTFDDIRRVSEDFRHHHSGDKFVHDIWQIVEPPILSFFYLLAFQKVLPDYAGISLGDFPGPFNQPASIDISELCHASFPEPLEASNALEKAKRFFSYFGFEFKTIQNGLLWVSIIDV